MPPTSAGAFSGVAQGFTEDAEAAECLIAVTLIPAGIISTRVTKSMTAKVAAAAEESTVGSGLATFEGEDLETTTNPKAKTSNNTSKNIRTQATNLVRTDVAAADLTAEEDLAVEEEVVDSAVGSGEASVVVSAVHPAAAVVSAEVAVAEEDLEVSMLNRMATAKHKQTSINNQNHRSGRRSFFA